MLMLTLSVGGIMTAIQEIVAPVDLDEHTEKLVEYANYMAEKLSANLTLIHVVELLRAMGDMLLGTPSIEEYNKKRVEQARELMDKVISDYPNCTGKVVIGEVVDEITKFAEAKEASLIIIGTHGSKGLEKFLLGSVAERVVKHAHCPTLVMNPYKQVKR